MDYLQSLIEQEVNRRKEEQIAQVAPSALSASDNYIYGAPGVPIRIRGNQETQGRNDRIINHPNGLPKIYYDSFPSI